VLNERQRAEKRVAKLVAIDQRGRAAFLENAEAQSRTAKGRPLTADELDPVTRRYPKSLANWPRLAKSLFD
jgi:antitoxin (DNA-binding transcriptional repressor) of toxin-antitoxin stability system